MKYFLCLIALLCMAASSLPAQDQPILLTVTGTPAAHTVRWNTNPTYCYELEVSPNLLTWTIVQNLISGTGDTMECHCTSPTPPARLYYRVRQLNPGFLARPLAGDTLYREEGVCFAFNLASAPATVTKIILSKRANSGAPWVLLGTLTDIVTFKGVKTVRGPAVWVAPALGSCEVKAEGKNAAGAILCTATRQITIAANTPPAVSVTGYAAAPPSGNAVYGRITFATQAADSNSGDEVTRVEYYDNGVLMGADHVAPFGNFTADLNEAYGMVHAGGNAAFGPSELLKGYHGITAKAYDTRGGVTESATYAVTIPTGNFRPRLFLPAEGEYFVRSALNTTIFILPFDAFDQDGHADLRDVSALGVFGIWNYPNQEGHGEISHYTQSWTPGSNTIIATAQDNPGTTSYKHPYHVLINSSQFATADVMAAQISTASAAFQPGSVRFFGPYAASQPYTGGTAAGLDASTTPAAARVMNSGVLLTTGAYSSWNGNDQVEDRTESWYSAGDAMMHDRVGGAYTRDAAVLEFDVNCQHGQLEMELQFGSEEYPERLGDPEGLSYDAFGVTVDGTLISLVPDGGAPISTKSIHPAIPGSVTIFPGDPNLPALREHLYLDDDAEIHAAAGIANQVECDGMTVRLRLHAFVTPGAHKIRISIADTEYRGTIADSQAAYDSGVFIRSGSIRTIAPTP